MSLNINTIYQTLEFKSTAYTCRIGRKGTVDFEKGREGDEKTPLGQYYMRFGFYRADRISRPNSPLTFRALRENDGWCDAPDDPAYNRLIRLPSSVSHERLWREDHIYDLIIVMSHNDAPPVKGLGSAVFLHVTQADERKTLGCVAFDPEAWVKLLPYFYCGMPIHIK